MGSGNVRRVPDFAAVDFSEYDEELHRLEREVERKDVLKPPCPECGATGDNIRSRGLYYWVCAVCKRWFVKNPRSGRGVVEMPEGLKCPECGESDIRSKGISWRCRSCGRVWIKDGRRSKKKD